MLLIYKSCLFYLFLIINFQIAFAQNLINKLKTNNNVNSCPLEYESLNCKCKSETDLIKDYLAIYINCNLNNNDKNVNFKIIPKINADNFQLVDYITHLDFTNTAVNEIQTDAFLGLNGITKITITKCENLRYIRMFAFRGLKSLQHLIITQNKNLIRIDAHAFGGLKNLHYLSLNGNGLKEIDGYVFSAAISIRTIDFLGNPIKKIKSFAFDGLRNVTELILSKKNQITEIETIEPDSFISTTFVDNIYLQGIHTKRLHTHSFRGLSNCKNLDLSNSYINEIDSHAFFRTINIELLNLSSSRIQLLNKNAFSGMRQIKLIDLRSNYLSKINSTTFSQLLSNANANTVVDMDGNANEKKVYFQNNPIQCDCNLNWILNNKGFFNLVMLPELCAGPKGYGCLSINAFKEKNISCIIDANSTAQELPCDRIVYQYKPDDTQTQQTERKLENEDTISETDEEIGESDAAVTTTEILNNFIASSTIQNYVSYAGASRKTSQSSNNRLLHQSQIANSAASSSSFRNRRLFFDLFEFYLLCMFCFYTLFYYN